MSTEQINIRLDADLVSALERVAREESLDRATAIRRLLETSIRQWQLERAITDYRRGDVSLGRAAEEAGLTQWELTDALRAAGVAYPLTAEDARRRLDRLGGTRDDAPAETLADIPPQPGGVLLVGINPAPVSVAAAHYYQGNLGRRLWRRLEGIGLLHDPVPGAEDEAFARAGHGLTDLVKRPARSPAELSADERREGVGKLRAKLREWQPALVLFAFSDAARWIVGKHVSPGRGPDLDGIPTFLLSGPYAAREEAERIDEELVQFVATLQTPSEPSERTQRVTAADLTAGRIRLPQRAKRFFPPRREDVEVVVRRTRLRAAYDPRLGPDRERSAVLSIGRERLRELVSEDEVLRVSRGLGGVVHLD